MIRKQTAVGNCVKVSSQYNTLTHSWVAGAVCRSVALLVLNIFAASYLNTQGLNNSCLKSPASNLVDLTFQSRALRSFSLNQLRNLSLGGKLTQQLQYI